MEYSLYPFTPGKPRKTDKKTGKAANSYHLRRIPNCTLAVRPFILHVVFVIFLHLFESSFSDTGHDYIITFIL